jgi:hypothetical protein
MTRDSTSDFRNSKKALELLAAYEVNRDVPAQDNPAYQDELRKLTSFDDADEMAAEWGRIVQGFVIMSSVFLGEIAQRSGTDREDLLAAYLQRTEDAIKQLAPE